MTGRTVILFNSDKEDSQGKMRRTGHHLRGNVPEVVSIRTDSPD